MPTETEINERLSACGYLGGDNRPNVVAAMLRGDTVIIIEQNLKPTYVGAYDRTIVRPLAELFPGAVHE